VIALASAQWLCAYKHSQGKAYLRDKALQRKMASLLRKSAETLENLNVARTPVYASIKSILADVYFAKGDYAQSIEEYELAESIFQEVYGDANTRTQYCKDRLNAAIAAMEGNE
jgi:tetratricopeptide (TPR) repeat protein